MLRDLIRHFIKRKNNKEKVKYTQTLLQNSNAIYGEE